MKIWLKNKRLYAIFNHYEEFLAILDHFSKGNCKGCRFNDKPTCQCSINVCHKKEKVNFCFECSKYSCNPTTYNESLTKVWRDNNDDMKKWVWIISIFPKKKNQDIN